MVSRARQMQMQMAVLWQGILKLSFKAAKEGGKGYSIFQKWFVICTVCQ